MASFYGVYRATILNVNDPMAQNRVQVLVPNVSGQTSGWATQCVPPGGRPAQASVGDDAFVVFEGGDAAFPVWIGGPPPP